MGDAAFSKKGIEKVYIPNTIKRFDANAFNDCPMQEMQFEENSSFDVFRGICPRALPSKPYYAANRSSNRLC
ncbi:MAG: hypothetical protein ACK5MI_02080 [Mangrovibacterium sp.]